MGRNPIGQRRIANPCDADHGAPRNAAIMGKVVATHHRERGRAALAALTQCLGDHAEHGSGCALAIALYVRVAGTEGTVSIEVVAALRDGKRHNADARIDHRGDYRGGIAGTEHFDHRARHARVRCTGGLLDHGRQPVLRGKIVAHGLIGSARANADHGEVVRQPLVHQPVEVDDLVRAVKVADTEVNDAGGQIGAGIGRCRNRGREAVQHLQR